MGCSGSHYHQKRKQELFNKKYPQGRKWFSVFKKLAKAIKDGRPKSMIKDLEVKLKKYE